MYFQLEGLIKRSDLKNPTYVRFFLFEKTKEKIGTKWPVRLR